MTQAFKTPMCNTWRAVFYLAIGIELMELMPVCFYIDFTKANLSLHHG